MLLRRAARSSLSSPCRLRFMSERTRDGLDAARARGRTGGQKPKLTPRQAKVAQDVYDGLGPDGHRKHRPADRRRVQRNTPHDLPSPPTARPADKRRSMTAPLQISLVAVALWIGSWLVMIVLAKRLPPGLLRDAAEFLPACVSTARRLRGNPAVPRRAKVALLIAILWVLSPIDLLPEFVPVIGPLDDVVAVVLLRPSGMSPMSRVRRGWRATCPRAGRARSGCRRDRRAGSVGRRAR